MMSTGLILSCLILPFDKLLFLCFVSVGVLSLKNNNKYLFLWDLQQLPSLPAYSVMIVTVH